jgi:hypothetical protein
VAAARCSVGADIRVEEPRYTAYSEGPGSFRRSNRNDKSARACLGKVERGRFSGPRYQPRPPARRSGCIAAEPYPPASPLAAYTDQPWHESGKSRGIHKRAEPPCSPFYRPGATRIHLTAPPRVSKLETMEIHLTAEQETQLSQIAALEGKGADELAREVFLRGLDAEASRLAVKPRNIQGHDAVARILELRRGNVLPEGVTIEDLIREGRA